MIHYVDPRNDWRAGALIADAAWSIVMPRLPRLPKDIAVADDERGACSGVRCHECGDELRFVAIATPAYDHGVIVVGGEGDQSKTRLRKALESAHATGLGLVALAPRKVDIATGVVTEYLAVWRRETGAS